MKGLPLFRMGRMCMCYALFYVLNLCTTTLYKKQAERGCVFNIPFHRLIPKSNGEQRTKNTRKE